MEHEATIEILDLGNATIETRQGSPAGAYYDSVYFLGAWPG